MTQLHDEHAEHQRMARMEAGERGSFAAAIATAWFRGDSKNKAMLELAFPKLFPDSGIDPHVAVLGNPLDGIGIHGPFVDHDAALAWVEDHQGDWWITSLGRPT